MLKKHRSPKLAQLVRDQETFRSLSALVARGASPEELFDAFAERIGRLLPGEVVAMGRYGSERDLTPVASWAHGQPGSPAEARKVLSGAGCELVAPQANATSPGTASSRAARPAPGKCAAVSVPVELEGRPWGVIAACSVTGRALEPDAGARLGEFAELMATVISTAESRKALEASRSRIVTAADQARRSIERDLHDGAQQRLVSLALELRTVQASVPPEQGELRDRLSRVIDGIVGVLDDLREIAHGIHPAVLDAGGLAPAIKSLARRSAVPVKLLALADGRFPEPVEVAAYYVVSEALANVAKHSHASLAQIALQARGRELLVFVSDDGVGGADPAGGSGLVGLKDRVEALGGTLSVSSQPGTGTALRALLPVHDPPAVPGSR